MSHFFSVDHLPGRTVAYEGQDYLFFSGTAYLGLQQHPEFQHLIATSISQYGSVFGSSRNGNLRLGVYEEAERKLAHKAGAPAALTLSSGMMSGQTVTNWLRSQHATFLYAPNAHPALWHEPTVSLPRLSLRDWTAQLPDLIQAVPIGQPQPIAILINSIDAVRSEYYDFSWVSNLPDDRSIILVVDDSHGLGILNEGRGIWPTIYQQIHRKRGSVQLLVTASLAKAMGLPGGVIFGNSEMIANLRQMAFFGACSPMPPACLAAYLQADALYAEGHERLRQNVALAEKRLLPMGLFRHAKGYPVFFTEHDGLYAYLLEQNILIYSFAYPTASDRANTRIVISAFHESADIDRLADCVATYQSLDNTRLL